MKQLIIFLIFQYIIIATGFTLTGNWPQVFYWWGVTLLTIGVFLTL